MTIAVNHLIELLPRKDRLSLLSRCEAVEMKSGEVLYVRGKPTRHAYFPTSGYISLVTMHEGRTGLEVGMIGSEGMLGEHLALGVVTAPLHAIVQGPDIALRIASEDFRKELASSVALQHVLDRYLYVRMSQLATSAACVRYHLIRPRLARWLLMSQDRAHSDSFSMTHEFMSYLLGVRRVGVTTAASKLQSSGLIKYHRGLLTVLDRRGLKAVACSCYEEDSKMYLKQLRGITRGKGKDLT